MNPEKMKAALQQIAQIAQEALAEEQPAAPEGGSLQEKLSAAAGPAEQE